MKRFFDIIFSIAGILFLFPLLLIIAALIKIDGPGPALFRQVRVGRNFKEFKIFKFRTMAPNSEKLGLITLKHDKRITQIGRVLRKYKLDELPQLFNVIRGDMSFVGPRPEVQDFVNKNKSAYEILLKERPGITSPSSIYFRNEEKLDHPFGDAFNFYTTVLIPKKIYLDFMYVNKKSFSYDLLLIILTIWSVINDEVLSSFDRQCRNLLNAQFEQSST
jgi:lipopolysaccharide/colanic/teichoic acid biosynthesis glycosyltransferase